MFNEEFQHDLIRKYVVLFGTLFNNIHISRDSSSETRVQSFKVPVAYGPREKFLAMVSQKPGSKIKAIQLPLMSFEITGMQQDPTRRFLRKDRYKEGNNAAFEPAPWNITFQLNILSKSDHDASKILEQALYYFNPDWTVSAMLIEGMQRTWDVSVVYDNVSKQDIYEGDFTQRRSLIWSVDFTLKGWLHGPVNEPKVIKFIKVNTHAGMPEVSTVPVQVSTIQPGLTAEGEPTTDIEQTIPYSEIQFDDNWDYIIQDAEVIEDE